MTKKKNLYLHFGAHKTGSSFLQDTFSHNKAFFKKRNSVFLNPISDEEQSTARLRKWQLGDWQNTPIPKSFIQYMDYISSLDMDVFLSREGYLGRSELNRSKTLYPTNKQVMQLIKNTFSDRSIKVAFCVRSYPDFIESCYNQEVKNGILTMSFGEYYKQIQINDFSWVPIIENMIEIFGRENVYLWENRQYKDDSRGINLKLIRFFYGDTVKASEIIYTDRKIVNPSLGDKQLEAMLALKSVLLRVPGMRKKTKLRRQIVRNTANIILRGLPYGKKPELIPATERQRLKDRYTEDIKTIEKIYGHKLGTY